MLSKFEKFLPAIICYFIGLVPIIIGTVFKIQHWPGANFLSNLGKITQVIAVIYAVVIAIRILRSRNS